MILKIFRTEGEVQREGFSCPSPRVRSNRGNIYFFSSYIASRALSTCIDMLINAVVLECGKETQMSEFISFQMSVKNLFKDQA